jgi:hypothetical protein
MKGLFRLALLVLPLTLAPNIGFAKESGPLSVASDDSVSTGSAQPALDFHDRRIRFRDIIIINRDLRDLLRAERNGNEANVLRDQAALDAAIDALLAGLPASPAV